MKLLDDFSDFANNLPLDVQRHVTRFRENDVLFNQIMYKIEDGQPWNGTLSKSRIKKLNKLLVNGLDIGDRKVEITQKVVDLVDDKVRNLENSMKKVISELQPDVSKPSIKEKTETGNCSKERSLPSTSTSTVTKELKKRNTDNDSNESNNDAKTTKRPRRNRADEPDYKEITDDLVAISALQHSNTPLPRATATAQVQSQVTLKKTTQKTETKTKKKGKYKKQQKDNSPSLDDDDDVAVDPDEPTYCLCDQISYGEMICCDNDLCPIEWFHFSCVTLSTKPKGKWFCPNCRGDRPNIMKPKALFLKELERYNKEKEEKA